MVRTFAARAVRKAATIVSSGTSNCANKKSAAPMAEVAAATSAGARAPLAPGTTRMQLRASSSTTIAATPVGWTGSTWMLLVSRPIFW